MDATAHVLEGWSRGELRVQHCRACSSRQFPPRAVCLTCRAADPGWTVLPPRGTIVTFTVVHRAPTPAWKERVPYVIALVDLVPGVRLMMNLTGVDLDRVAIGAPVAVAFARGSDGQNRPEARLG